MVQVRPTSDPRPNDAAIIRATFTRVATQLGHVPTLREFESLSGIPRTTASRYIDAKYRDWLLKTSPKLNDRRVHAGRQSV